MNEELNMNLGEESNEAFEPIEEPSKVVNIGDIEIELCNELIQLVNDELHLSFTTNSSLNDIQNAFATNTEPITYSDQSYKGYTIIKDLSMTLTNEDKYVYHIYLVKPEPETIIDSSIQYALDFAISTVSDEQSLNCISIFPEWDGHSKLYKKNDRCKYQNRLYKVLLDHTSQEDWTPDTASSLFVEIADPSIEYPDFKQPTGAHNAYNTGDKVTFNGKHYICKMDACTWSPSDYPQAWELVED